jgi:hypothetical protein
VGAGLLPSAVPSVCVGGLVLCGGGLATVPVSPPAALPTVCVPGVACTTDVTGSPTPSATARPSATPTVRPTATVTSPPPAGPTNAPVALLPAPPGVGLVPLPNAALSDAAFSPDSFANLLSLSMRDGLGSARYHVWPWLLGIQLVLWTVIAVVAWSRQLRAPSRPR